MCDISKKNVSQVLYNSSPAEFCIILQENHLKGRILHNFKGWFMIPRVDLEL